MPCSFEIEKKLLSKYAIIGGVDEAGRGPLAGPVVSALVILKSEIFLNLRDEQLLEINDSKKLSEKKRERLFDKIQECALAYEISEVSHEEIDQTNILAATHASVVRAYQKITPPPHCLILDALTIKSIDIPQFSFVKGDQKSYSIAAASILAKVYRDRKMKEYDRLYPEYGFAKHKGYGVKAHLEAIKKYGPCPIHRRSFAPMKKM